MSIDVGLFIKCLALPFVMFQVYNGLFILIFLFLSPSLPPPNRVEKLEYKEIITPSWREVHGGRTASDSSAANEPTRDNQEREEKCDHQPPPQPAAAAAKEVKKVEECQAPKSVNLSSAEDPPTSHTPPLDSGEEDTSNAAYSRRHDKCEAIEKQKFLNFISGGSRKRTRPQSLASTPDASTAAARASSPHPLASTVASTNGKGKQKRVLVSPTPSEVELASLRREILPWNPREFPLNEQNFDALTNIPPPPKLVPITPSPSPMELHSTTPTDFKPSRTPSTTSTAAATPLSSPTSTPSEETPAISPAEWTVHYNNTQFTHTKAHFPSLVLRLSKRTV